jgi:hypothetical protein
MYIFLGFLIIILAAVVQAYCEFGRYARPDYKPKILKERFRFVMEGLWILLMAIGAAVLWLPYVFSPTGAILAVIGIFVFWLILPFIITPIMRNRLLPPWDQVKKELEPKGYNERDYWRGDWWMIESKQKRRKH